MPVVVTSFFAGLYLMVAGLIILRARRNHPDDSMVFTVFFGLLWLPILAWDTYWSWARELRQKDED